MNASVGIIGVGLMGHGIASNIAKAGWPLGFLHRQDNQNCDDLIQSGAQAHDSIAGLVSNSDIIILCVTGAPEVEEVILSETGVIGALKAGSTVIDCSTSIPATTKKIAAAVQDAGGRFLDAPMTRTPKEAAEGRLNLIVGGDKVLLDEHRPLLECFAENIAHAGGIGAGHTMKLVHNFVSLGYSAVLAEAAACAERAGIENSVLVEVLAKGGGAGVILDRLSPYILDGDSSAFQFALGNAHKDLGYYLNMAADLNAQHRAAEGIQAQYSRACESLGPISPVPTLIDTLK